MSFDPYLDLDAGILRNKLGITDRDELNLAEAQLTAVRLVELYQNGLLGQYDLEHLQAFHYALFQDVYDWAGQLRTVNIGKGALFCLPGDLLSTADDTFAWLRDSHHLHELPRGEFLDQLTELYSDLNFLHPFREGNGRTQRAFLGQLVRDAGHQIRWADMNPTTNNAASRTSMDGENTALRALLDELLDHADGPAETHPDQPPLPHQRDQ